MTPDLRVQSTELSSSNKESWQGPGTKSVSYTHLDVYKRQDQHNEQDQGRYGPERKITKLSQQFIHELTGGGSRND